MSHRLRLVAAAVSVLVLGATLATPSAALAAVPGGPATVTTTVDYVSASDFVTPIAELKAAPAQGNGPERQFALRIGYGCGSSAACTGVSITVDPQQLDQFYGTQRFASFVSVTLPAGASRTGTDATGYTITLGNLAAGATGTFTMVFDWQGRSGAPAPQSFFLDGTNIVNRVTIDANNAGATASATDSLVWHVDTKAPQVAFGTQGIARADTNYDYVVRMGSDCMWYQSVGTFGEPSKLCAQSYTNTFHLPDGAVFVQASDGGTYDSAQRTVTWSDNGQAAAPGWESITGFGLARTVTVQFPSSMFSEACTVDVTAGFDTSVVYLDGQSKTALTSVTNKATSCTPFAAAQPLEKWSSTQQAPNIVWDGAQTNNWNVQVGNKANVAGVAVITDDLRDVEHIRVDRVVATGGTIRYTLDNGATGTASGSYTAPAARRIVEVTVTSPVLEGPNLTQADISATTRWTFTMRYSIVGSAPAEGWPISNTASAVMTYPDTGLADFDEGVSTASVVAAPRPANFLADIRFTAPEGNPVAGTPVTFSMSGTTSAMDAGATLEPQYVFTAPYQWTIIDDSWALDAGAPAGAIVERKVVTVDGDQRQSLGVSWPEGTVWGVNSRWPALTVQATPTAAAPAGSRVTASGFIGDASGTFRGLAATWGGTNNGQRYVDATDLDGDGDVAEYLGRTSTNIITVGAASALSTLKEICQADPEARDGCEWISDSSRSILVSPLETGIRYRVTIQNNGNTALQDVVAYDVLPYVGDVGVSAGSSTTPRGSRFAESLSDVSEVSSALTLSYSASTNPCREQVYPGAPDCVDDWDQFVDGKVAIRAALGGPLSAHASVSFEYTASVIGTPGAGEKACNSIASAATGVPISEPSPVCAEIVAADLAVTAGNVPNPQVGRPAVLPFTVANLAGTDSAALAPISIPAGIRVTGLAGDGWSCAADGAGDLPIDGPLQLDCTVSEPLAPGDETRIELPVVITAANAVIDAGVEGPLFDPDTDNNDARITIAAAPPGGLTVTKDDQKSALVRGQETTYAITVANQLVGESVAGVTAVDTLPEGMEVVSVGDGGVFDDDARTITWNIAQIGAAGTWETSVTVRVAQDAVGTTLSNLVEADATDPAFPEATLTSEATDVDHLDAISLRKTGEIVAPGDGADPRPGDVVEYRFVVANVGGGTLTGVDLTDGMEGLSAITFPEGWPAAVGTLAAGQSVNAVARYTLTGADIDGGRIENLAEVTADSAGGGQVSDESIAPLDLPAIGGIELTKDVDFAEDADVRHEGDEIVYSFEIGNSGNATLHDVAISDALEGLSNIEYTWPTDADGILPAGSSATASATYALTQADIDRGTVDNSASVAGIDVTDAEVSDTADAQLVIPAAPSVSLEKTGTMDAERPVPGDLAEFEFTVTNIGNVTLTGVTIEDELAGLGDLEFAEWPDGAGVLAPGEHVIATAQYALSQEDIDAGVVDNAATALAVPARGEGVEASDDVSVPLAQVPGLSVVKRAALADSDGNGVANPGETIAFDFLVENTGNVTLTDVRVVDAMVSGLQAVSSLAPGESVLLSADRYTVTLADALLGAVRNTATVVGDAPDGSAIVSDSSSTSTAAGIAESLAATGGAAAASLALLAVAFAGVGVMLLRRRAGIRS
ncbi:DUF11 domain-containing protein [Microbacterium sp. EST19A]|uniref:DUF7507 domain-containing protein n=1 Tax=Microbacterium sp. EST19A TaxID=2862681 RepID=UPI001CBD735E|nr:DUF11 domain-containing protein [Microbacterium sp. EST19A]